MFGRGECRGGNEKKTSNKRDKCRGATAFNATPIHCGGVSVRAGLTAAQTMECGQCGRGGATVRLAPDGGVSVDNDLADPLPSGASPLPQGLCGVSENGAHRRPARVLTSTHTAPPTFVICHLMVDGFIYTEYCT